MNIKTIDQVEEEIKRVTLNELLGELKDRGITQKRLAKMFGMQPNFLTTVKRCERKGHYYKFLGACKMGCIYLLGLDKGDEGYEDRANTKREKIVSANDIYKKYEDVDDALEEIKKEAEKRIDLFAEWLMEKKLSEYEVTSYCNNIFNCLMVITQHEPPYIFLAEAKDDITQSKINKAESYGFLFKYNIFLDSIKETAVDEDLIKALRLYFEFLLENNFIKKIPKVVKDVSDKENIYLRRLREYHESYPEDEREWMDWFEGWCEEVFGI